jgi:two-component system CheB/CheR fusion protein
MGSDGTLGLRAIKEKGGVTFVQEPASAKCPSMPKSAIDAGLADFSAPVEALPGKIIAYLNRAPLIAKSGLARVDKARSGLEKILILLRDQAGHDFSLYKNTSVYRRIERRMGIHQIDNMATYVRFLQENSQEIGLLFKELLIGVTSFFRDPAAVLVNDKGDILYISGRTGKYLEPAAGKANWNIFAMAREGLR